MQVHLLFEPKGIVAWPVCERYPVQRCFVLPKAARSTSGSDKIAQGWIKLPSTTPAGEHTHWKIKWSAVVFCLSYQCNDNIRYWQGRYEKLLRHFNHIHLVGVSERAIQCNSIYCEHVSRSACKNRCPCFISTSADAVISLSLSVCLSLCPSVSLSYPSPSLLSPDWLGLNSTETSEARCLPLSESEEGEIMVNTEMRGMQRKQVWKLEGSGFW